MKSGESRTVLPFGQHAALRSRDHRPEEPRGLAPTRSRPGGLTERFRVTLGSSPSVAADPDRPAADLREPRRKISHSTAERRLPWADPLRCAEGELAVFTASPGLLVHAAARASPTAEGRRSSPTKINKEVISRRRARRPTCRESPSALRDCDRQRSWRCLRDRRTTGFPQIRAVRAVRRPFWLDGNACRATGG